MVVWLFGDGGCAAIAAPCIIVTSAKRRCSTGMLPNCTTASVFGRCTVSACKQYVSILRPPISAPPEVLKRASYGSRSAFRQVAIVHGKPKKQHVKSMIFSARFLRTRLLLLRSSANTTSSVGPFAEIPAPATSTTPKCLPPQSKGAQTPRPFCDHRATHTPDAVTTDASHT